MNTGFDLLNTCSSVSSECPGYKHALPVCALPGRDGRGWTDPDGRRIRGWGRTPDHPFGEHSVWRHQRPGRRGRFQQLPSFGQQCPLEQQTSCCSGQQTREHSATTIAVKPHPLLHTDWLPKLSWTEPKPPLTAISSQICPSEYFLLLPITKTQRLAELHSNIHTSKTFSAYPSYATQMNWGVFENAFGKQQINFFCSDLQTWSSHLLEYNSCDWMTCRSQVIMLTVESVRKKTIWSNKQNVSENGKLCFLSASRSQWKQLTALKTNETLFEAFLFEVSLAVCLFVSTIAVFPFPVKGKIRALCRYGLGDKGKKHPWTDFPLNRSRRKLWFHTNPIECAHGLLVFCLSQNSLRLEDFKDHHVNFANYATVIFSFPENWTLLPLMTYSQTDTKAFSCMIL